MIKPKIGFVVYGTHKDGLQDPQGQPFIDDQVVNRARQGFARLRPGAGGAGPGHCHQTEAWSALPGSRKWMTWTA
jgi:hypothetical protein